MDVKAIIYLKTGLTTSMTIYDTTLAEQKALYTQVLDGTHHYELLSHCGTNSIQLIPTENISFIDLQEVSKKGE